MSELIATWQSWGASWADKKILILILMMIHRIKSAISLGKILLQFYNTILRLMG